MTTPRKITPEDHPVFPCWVWDPELGHLTREPIGWQRWLEMPWRTGHYLYWHPDQPTTPATIPAPAAANTGPNHRMEGATPRTDARKFTILSDLQSGTREVVDVEVSERLERELAEAQHELAEARTVLTHIAYNNPGSPADYAADFLRFYLRANTTPPPDSNEPVEFVRAEYEALKAELAAIAKQAQPLPGQPVLAAVQALSALRARDNIGMSREEYHKVKKALDDNAYLRAECEALQAKVTELKGEAESTEKYLASRWLVPLSNEAFAAVDKIVKVELDTLRARLLELEEDKADLDWLEAEARSGEIILDIGHNRQQKHDTLRAAIRAARKGAK